MNHSYLNVELPRRRQPDATSSPIALVDTSFLQTWMADVTQGTRSAVDMPSTIYRQETVHASFSPPRYVRRQPQTKLSYLRPTTISRTEFALDHLATNALLHYAYAATDHCKLLMTQSHATVSSPIESISHLSSGIQPRSVRKTGKSFLASLWSRLKSTAKSRRWPKNM